MKVSEAFDHVIPETVQDSDGANGSQPIVLAVEMKHLYRRAEQVASSRIPVLIVGETGVGKEHLAERIHTHSPRAQHPFVRINCAAIAPSLFEAELFGHERGAFTGADRTKLGWLEAAGAGTVFLDEIGDIQLDLQAKLLRALETRAAPRVGGTTLRPIQARFVTASNRDLEAEVDRGCFRRDLFYRIAGVQLRVPPLRQRPTEVIPLAEAFVCQAARDNARAVPRFTGAAKEALLQHCWPGNIRELRNVINAAILFAEGPVIDAGHLQLTARVSATPCPLPPHVAVGTPVQPGWGGLRLTRESIVSALADCGGNQTLAAAQLGVGRRTLCRWLVRLGLPRPRRGPAAQTPPYLVSS